LYALPAPPSRTTPNTFLERNMKVSAMQVRALSAWTAALDYRVIRSVESLQPSRFPDGRRVRGVTLAPKLVLARDGQFYDVSQPVARHLSPQDLLSTWTLDQLKTMFRLTFTTVRARRHAHAR
jgi:hypothetical protein